MDQKLLFLINRQWTGPVEDRAMALLSSFAAWAPLFAGLLVLMLWRGGFHGRVLVLCGALVIGINDGLISRTLKHAIHRPRPYQSEDGVREVDLARVTPRILAMSKPLRIKYSHPEADIVGNGGRSFPSSHTINTFSVALLVAFFYRWGWVAFLPALGVGYSRIYTGSHWPSDVLASIFLGLGSTFLILSALEWLWRRCGEKWVPGLHERHPSLLPR